jgi:hypothetical protein
MFARSLLLMLVMVAVAMAAKPVQWADAGPKPRDRAGYVWVKETNPDAEPDEPNWQWVQYRAVRPKVDTSRDRASQLIPIDTSWSGGVLCEKP